MSARLLSAAVLLVSGPALAAVPEGAAGEISAVRAAVDEALHWIAMAVEVTGVGIIVAGAVIASALFLRSGLGAEGWERAYEGYRANLGRAILIGLELLVAADIIGTVAVEPSLYNLGVLAVIVAIRTVLSFTLTLEVTGRWPWQQHEQRPVERAAP